jgi:hypothetical protein
MGFQITEMLGVSVETVLIGAAAALAVAVLMAVVRSRRSREADRTSLGLGGER